jgi:dipeptidase
MCDTFVKIEPKRVIFGKNSDREPNEAQAIVRIPAMRQQEKTLRCTFIEIPQVDHTYEVLLSKPFQMWGAEMGANEHGVVIGNEAVFTKVPFRKKNDGLTGMDLLRLALERSKTAQEALEWITDLLEKYGQDACGGYKNRRFFYHNSFLIADSEGAYVLETAGQFWVAKKIDTQYSISNGLTISDDFDLLSYGTVDYARQKGLVKRDEVFHFDRAFSDWFMTYMSNCKVRREHTAEGISKASFDVRAAMENLCQHDEKPDEVFNPGRGSTACVCMHATGPANPSQTTGSMVVELKKGQAPVVWFTGTSMPCLSVWMPFFFGGKTLSGPDWHLPGAQADDSLWWTAERLHRKIVLNYPQGRSYIAEERKNLQAEFLAEVEVLFSHPHRDASAADELSANLLHQRLTWLNDLLQHETILDLPLKMRTPWVALYQYANNRSAKI